ncbi:MAG: electron transfer flavoprotein subunit alpha/FixB family protein, partial [Thermoprotei archaeon]
EAATPGSGKEAWCIAFGESHEFSTALEVLSKVSALGLRPVAVSLGEAPEDFTRDAFSHGAIHVIKASGPSFATYSSTVFSQTVSELIRTRKPYAVLFPSTVRGREVAARVTSRLRLGLTGDAVDLKIKEGRLIQVKPAFGGNIMAEIVSRTEPQMATVRPGVFKKTVRPAGSPTVENIVVQHSDHVPEKRVSHSANSLVENLDHADKVFCVGFGAGSKQEFDAVRSEAHMLGYSVAASRKVVDAGWAEPQLQVGLTGKSIAPRLYVALAVSGATNHMIGVRRAHVILAVNKDPAARIFEACDVGLVADYTQCRDRLFDLFKRIAGLT